MYGPFPTFITIMTLIIPRFLLFYPIPTIVTTCAHGGLYVGVLLAHFPTNPEIWRTQMDLF